MLVGYVVLVDSRRPVCLDHNQVSSLYIFPLFLSFILFSLMVHVGFLFCFLYLLRVCRL